MAPTYSEDTFRMMVLLNQFSLARETERLEGGSAAERHIFAPPPATELQTVVFRADRHTH